jgi:hypothetical protein
MDKRFLSSGRDIRGRKREVLTEESSGILERGVIDWLVSIFLHLKKIMPN